MHGKGRLITNPTMQHVIYIDLETTDLIGYRTQKFPWIIEFSATTYDGEIFRSTVTPDDHRFDIHPEATNVHGWTRDTLLAQPFENRPYFYHVW